MWQDKAAAAAWWAAASTSPHKQIFIVAGHQEILPGR